MDVDLKITKPEWFAKLQAGGPLPPEPSEGWGRWWEDSSGYIWLIIVAGAITLTFHVIGELTANRLRSQGT